MKYIGYFRVSSKEQGRSGLGLEAQESIVSSYVNSRQGELIATYTDTVSGFKKSKQRKRTELLEAVEHCKKEDAVLVVAKLDRLSRSIVQLFELINESGIKFYFCDVPDANTMTLGIMASVAQFESERKSERLKEAFAAKRKRLGVKKLPLHENSANNLSDDGRSEAWERSREKARDNENNRRATELIKMYKGEGMSLAAIAERLNNNGFSTSTGKRFHKTTVSRLYKRYLEEAVA